MGLEIKEDPLKITPLEIRKQEFKKSMRGYDPVEVDTFLEMVGNDYEKLLDQNKQNIDKVKELETELKNYKEVERTLKQTLMNVQENSDKSRENSRKEADLMRKEAELEANEMIDKAKLATQKMREELITFQTQKQSLIARLRHVLSSQLELLDVLETDDVDISKLKDRTKKVFSGAKKGMINQPVPKSNSEMDVKITSSKRTTDDKKDPNPEDTSDKDGKDSDIFTDVFGDKIDLDDHLDQK